MNLEEIRKKLILACDQPHHKSDLALRIVTNSEYSLVINAKIKGTEIVADVNHARALIERKVLLLGRGELVVDINLEIDK